MFGDMEVWMPRSDGCTGSVLAAVHGWSVCIALGVCVLSAFSIQHRHSVARFGASGSRNIIVNLHLTLRGLR